MKKLEFMNNKLNEKIKNVEYVDCLEFSVLPTIPLELLICQNSTQQFRCTEVLFEFDLHFAFGVMIDDKRD